MLRGEQTELWFARGGIWNSESYICTQSVFILETYNVRIVIVEVLLSTHCNFKWLSRIVDSLKSLGIHSTPWWHSMELYDVPWNSIDLQGKYMKFHGIPWNSINTSWNNPMAFHGTPWILHGTPWHSMELHGYSIHGIPWISIDFRVIPWISIDVHGFPWNSIP